MKSAPGQEPNEALWEFMDERLAQAVLHALEELELHGEVRRQPDHPDIWIIPKPQGWDGTWRIRIVNPPELTPQRQPV